MSPISSEAVALTAREYELAERRGKMIKANPPAIQGLDEPKLRTSTVDGMVIAYDVEIPVRDATILRANIFRPEQRADEKLPVLLNYSVYGKDDILHVSMFPTTSGLDRARISKYYVFEGCDALWWTQRGYIVAYVDVRGSFQSDGNKHYYSRDVGLDGYDVVEWLGAQPWSNGKVGMYGASAYAMLQWQVAAEQPPALAAILPFDGMTDLYREMARKGGIPETQFMGIYPLLFNWGRGLVEDTAKAHYDHPFFDEYWQSKIPALESITCPAYIVCGWGDHGIHTRGTLNGWKQISSKEKYLEVHSSQKWEYAVTEESLARQKAFFDTYLLGQATEVQFWPRVRYTMREAYYISEWRYTSLFPIPDTNYRRFYPVASKGLSDVPQPKKQFFSHDAVTGETTVELPVLESLEFAGHAKLRLWVEADGADNMDLFVTLRKIDTKGNEVVFPWLTIAPNGPIGFGWLRVSRRELDEKRSTDAVPFHSHTRDLLLQPGEIVPVDIEIQPTACRFRAGDRLQVVISGHDYGTYPSNIPIARHNDTVNKGTHKIHFGGEYDSYLQLPQIPQVQLSMQEYGRNVKMAVIASRVKGWSDEKFVHEYTEVHAKMTQQVSAMVPYLRSYIQLVARPASPDGKSPQNSHGFDMCTTLSWASLDKLRASFRHPGYQATAKQHVLSEGHMVGSLNQLIGDIMFDPIRYDKRKDAVIALIFIPRNSSVLSKGSQLSKDDVALRLDTIRKAGAGTGLLRYVLNHDVTPDNPQEFFDNTPFVDGSWGDISAFEQYWFANEDDAAQFFEKSRKAVLESLPPSLDSSSLISAWGTEVNVVKKDVDF